MSWFMSPGLVIKELPPPHRNPDTCALRHMAAFVENTTKKQVTDFQASAWVYSNYHSLQQGKRRFQENWQET